MNRTTLNRLRLAASFMVAAAGAAYFSVGPKYFNDAANHEHAKQCEADFIEVSARNHLPLTEAQVGHDAQSDRCVVTYPDQTRQTWARGTTQLDR